MFFFTVIIVVFIDGVSTFLTYVRCVFMVILVRGTLTLFANFNVNGLAEYPGTSIHAVAVRANVRGDKLKLILLLNSAGLFTNFPPRNNTIIVIT